MSKGTQRPKVSQIKEVPPRSLEEIQKSYAELISKLGQAKYHAFVYEQEVEKLNNQLMALNHEASKRNQLDAEAKASKPAEASNV